MPYVRATDLYELANCPHRLALDRRLTRLERSAPDEATRLLSARGEAWERDVASVLGYPQPEYELGDFEEGARQTEALLRAGVPGVYQPVLLRGRFLAIPDLVEKVDDGVLSALGPWHYAPGDVKAGLTPRADQVLQVAFAGWLLADLQMVAPAYGFLVLGDRRREDFALGEVAHVLAAAKERVCEIADGLEETAPFFDLACGHCRWKGTCLPELLAANDLSLVDGMTRTRRRILERAGVADVAGLAALDTAAWRDESRPALGLDALVRQAAALVDGRIAVQRALELPPAHEDDVFLYAERDPLEGGAVILLAWCAADMGAVEFHAPVSDDERRAALGALFARLETSRGHAYHFGAAAPRGLLQLTDLAGTAPQRQVALEERLADLAVTLRRGTAFLPVRRYTLGEIGAALAGAPLPLPGDDGTPAFVYAEHLRRGSEGPWREGLAALARARLEQLAALHAWMRRQTPRAPRRTA